MKPPYEITNTILYLYGQITEALGMSKSLLLVKPEAKLRRQNRIKTIYSSLAIEGNTLGIEHVSALIDNKRIVGPKKDILEVQNAIKAYQHLNELKPYSMKDFLKAHGILMEGLVDNPGKFRNSQVGIIKEKEVTHIAPGYNMVPDLMKDLFEYIKKDKDLDIIKSCVFHYEMEFIHPFEDGNGRMGRFWQTRLLMDANPIFEYVPVEETIKNHQEEYYKSLEKSDNSGSSTIFIEFMLDAINKSLRETIEETNVPNIDYSKRIEYALSQLTDWFDRKEYMKINKGISTATASRDLKQLLEDEIIESTGTGRMTKYRKVNKKKADT
ncbi:Fic family protein [Brucepastera parasyntrophica]|uniref:Fic family protein n=1 Tax=Brucepastera parasyntrophica TaxID=2880008 RepID=UPI00210934A9|nr:Fic family protein [Brucepastera parasyntrophica]ULQ61028.1 Fic family protein [Brucepastera parasyntrophica]